MLSALTAGWRRAARVLDRVYLAAGVTAAAFLVLLLAAVALQVTARWAGGRKDRNAGVVLSGPAVSVYDGAIADWEERALP